MKAERAIDKGNIVIDSFRNTTDAHLNVLLSQLLLKSQNTSVSTVTPNNVKLIYFHLFDSSDHFLSFESATAGPQYSPTEVMNILNNLRVKFHPVLREILVEATIAPFNTPYFSHLIVVPKTHHD